MGDKGACKRALLIIDVQNDFANADGSLSVADGMSVVDPIIKLMQQDHWTCVAMTRDWHPAGHVSFARSHGVEEFSSVTYESPAKEGETQQGTLWPVHCVQKSWGAQVVEPLEQAFKDLAVPHRLVDKGALADREYYSGFNDIWDIHHTELDDFLRLHEISDVIVVGLALDYCVKSTAISASKLGYKTAILRSHTRAIYADDASVQKLSQELSDAGVQLLDEIVYF
ncbi:nicotinamidase Ecym_1410 [Eremothecium cymbalariae DBVPG|uniref:nicotinamidase n=1 Tax=Eremothecium cymbalariae (strain CBS 270.75 / DBVPG 7215 / KCTC 17166 / NRRL Y-17582) TaxID=931890 RepID=G8JM67_ERECY|nr:hypothetical protein Ecym_1410 [Eremothecium cymbalariae DBVPG\